MCELCTEAANLWQRVDDSELTAQECEELFALAEAVRAIPGAHFVGAGTADAGLGDVDAE